jgi:hypothetical protein
MIYFCLTTFDYILRIEVNTRITGTRRSNTHVAGLLEFLSDFWVLPLISSISCLFKERQITLHVGEGLRETTGNINHVVLFLGRDLNPELLPQ